MHLHIIIGDREQEFQVHVQEFFITVFIGQTHRILWCYSSVGTRVFLIKEFSWFPSYIKGEKTLYFDRCNLLYIISCQDIAAHEQHLCVSACIVTKAWIFHCNLLLCLHFSYQARTCLWCNFWHHGNKKTHQISIVQSTPSLELINA